MAQIRCKCLRWASAALVLSLVFGGVAAADRAATIRDAFSELLSGKGSPADTEKVLQVLVETLGQMAEQTPSVPPGARSKILEAAKAFRENPALDGHGAATLRSAWGEFSPGQPYSFPEGAKDPAAITRAVQNRVDSCLKAIETGDGARAVKDLLEALLMVITPVPVQLGEPG